MTRGRAAGLIGAVVVLTMVLVAPVAQASSRHPSASCRLSAAMTFKPALMQGANTFEFIQFKVRLHGCSGGGVTHARGYAGAAGTLTCDSGALSGRLSAKMQVFWNTGAESGLNGFLNLTRSALHGKVLGGLFRGERAHASFTVTPLDGDCASTPLAHAKMTGALSL